MGREVTFDYSKTSGFISTEELQNIKGAFMGAKEVLPVPILAQGRRLSF